MFVSDMVLSQIDFEGTIQILQPMQKNFFFLHGAISNILCMIDILATKYLKIYLFIYRDVSPLSSNDEKLIITIGRQVRLCSAVHHRLLSFSTSGMILELLCLLFSLFFLAEQYVLNILLTPFWWILRAFEVIQN